MMRSTLPIAAIFEVQWKEGESDGYSKEVGKMKLKKNVKKMKDRFEWERRCMWWETQSAKKNGGHFS